MCTFSFNKCPIYAHDGASAKFMTNSHETNKSAALTEWFLALTELFPALAELFPVLTEMFLGIGQAYFFVFGLDFFLPMGRNSCLSLPLDRIVYCFEQECFILLNRNFSCFWTGIFSCFWTGMIPACGQACFLLLFGRKCFIFLCVEKIGRTSPPDIWITIQ